MNNTTNLEKNTRTHSMVVYKSNDIIQNARFDLSLTEQRIMNFILCFIEPGDTELMQYDFDIKDFVKFFDISDNSRYGYYAHVKTVLKALSDKSLYIKDSTNPNVETIARWILRPYLNSESMRVRVELDPKMKPYLLNLKNHFTGYSALYSFAMKCKYSPRIYELLRSRIFGEITTYTVDIAKFREMLSINTYSNFGNFRKNVLERAILEINETSDMEVTYFIIGSSRYPSKIKFNVVPKEVISPLPLVLSHCKDNVCIIDSVEFSDNSESSIADNVKKTEESNYDKILYLFRANELMSQYDYSRKITAQQLLKIIESHVDGLRKQDAMRDTLLQAMDEYENLSGFFDNIVIEMTEARKKTKIKSYVRYFEKSLTGRLAELSLFAADFIQENNNCRITRKNEDPQGQSRDILNGGMRRAPSFKE